MVVLFYIGEIVLGWAKKGTKKVISNEDSLLMMKFHSVDLQANIKEGKNYDFTLRGYRVPILSWFPNLDGAEPQN